MFSFTKEQEIIDVSGVKIGGQPGYLPTVLFGGLFFKGNPDFDKAKKDLADAFKLSRQTGNPLIADFFIKKEEYLEDIVKFINNTLPKNIPFSVDIIEPKIKIKVLEILHEKKLLSRTIYNSIHIGITDEERKAIQEFTPDAAIVVENGANLTDAGLIEITKKLGIKKVLLDTAALAPGDNSGAAIAAIPVVKEEYGYPVGCAIHNVVEKSSWLEHFPAERKIVDASSNVNIALFGGDFAIYGPIEHARMVVPIIAWQDILISEYVVNYFGIEPSKNHPRRILF